MNEPIDWEAAMKATEFAAKAAARQSERTVGGVAELLEAHRHLSSEIRAIRETTAIDRSNAELDQNRHTMEQSQAERSPPLWPFVAIAFVAGSVLGGFFVS